MTDMFFRLGDRAVLLVWNLLGWRRWHLIAACAAGALLRLIPRPDVWFGSVALLIWASLEITQEWRLSAETVNERVIQYRRRVVSRVVLWAALIFSCNSAFSDNPFYLLSDLFFLAFLLTQAAVIPTGPREPLFKWRMAEA